MQQLLISREQLVISSVHQVEDVPGLRAPRLQRGEHVVTMAVSQLHMGYHTLNVIKHHKTRNRIIQQPAGLHDWATITPTTCHYHLLPACQLWCARLRKHQAVGMQQWEGIHWTNVHPIWLGHISSASPFGMRKSTSNNGSPPRYFNASRFRK